MCVCVYVGRCGLDFGGNCLNLGLQGRLFSIYKLGLPLGSAGEMKFGLGMRHGKILKETSVLEERISIKIQVDKIGPFLE